MNWNFFKHLGAVERKTQLTHEVLTLHIRRSVDLEERIAALEAKQARNDADIPKMLDAMTGMLDYTNKVEDRVDSLEAEVGQIDANIGRVARVLRENPLIPKAPKLTEKQLKARLAYLKNKAAKAMGDAA
jgi:uncharacterized coiled-coil protein SlyX